MGELVGAILLRPLRNTRNGLIAAVRGALEKLGGVRAGTDAYLEMILRKAQRSSGREALDLLYVALVLSVTGEVAAVLAGLTMLVFLFFLATMFLCVVVWRWD